MAESDLAFQTEAARGNRRERRIAARKAQILRAAELVFSQKGYERATTRDIADAADVSEGTLYNYYGGKSDLLDAVARSFADEITAEIGELEAEVGQLLLGPGNENSFAMSKHVCLLLFRMQASLRHPADFSACFPAGLPAADSPPGQGRPGFPAGQGWGLHYVRRLEPAPKLLKVTIKGPGQGLPEGLDHQLGQICIILGTIRSIHATWHDTVDNSFAHLRVFLKRPKEIFRRSHWHCRYTSWISDLESSGFLMM